MLFPLSCRHVPLGAERVRLLLTLLIIPLHQGRILGDHPCSWLLREQFYGGMVGGRWVSECRKPVAPNSWVVREFSLGGSRGTSRRNRGDLVDIFVFDGCSKFGVTFYVLVRPDSRLCNPLELFFLQRFYRLYILIVHRRVERDSAHTPLPVAGLRVERSPPRVPRQLMHIGPTKGVKYQVPYIYPRN